MKPYLLVLAEYNRRTNSQMLRVLEGVPRERLVKPTGSYFDSVMGLLNHVLQSDTLWLRRLAGRFEPLSFLERGLDHLRFGGFRDVLLDELPAFRAERERVDGLIERAVGALPEGEYEAPLVYRNRQGEEQRKLTGHVLLHLFLHQAHHRGQVALLLDQAGVENDYSSLVAKF